MEEQNQPKQKKRLWKKWWFWLLIILFLFIILVSISGGSKEPSDKYKNISTEEIKQVAIENPGYDELFRNNSQYIGKVIHSYGKIVQVQEISSNNFTLRANVTKDDSGFWEDDVFLYYKGERLLEDDIINFWGEVKGVKNYKTVLGASRSIPGISVLYLEVVKNKEEELTIPKTLPSGEQTTVSKIPNLTSIRISGGIWENWDADAEKDGPVIDIVYLDSQSEIISDKTTESLPISADVEIFTKTSGKKDKKVYSASFTEDKIIFGGIYPKIRIPKEEIDVNPASDYQYGYVVVTIHTPEQGDFSDEDDLITLYQEENE